MNINAAIWGAADTWPAASGTFSTVGKVANFNNQGTNLYTAVNQNILSFSQKIQDKSLSWCGLGTESNYGHIKLFANSTDDIAPNAERFVDNQEITNFFFYNIPSGDNAVPQNCIMTVNNALYLWDSTFTMQNANLYIQPFTEFNIKKILWLVQVSCSDTITGTIHTYDYNDYVTNYKTVYPVIRYISAIPYKETSNSPLTRGSFIGEYPCTMKPAIFNGYSVYTNVPTDTFADYAIFSEDRDYSLLLFGSKAQNNNNRYTVGIGNCKRKYTSPRSTYQDENINSVLDSALKTIACFGFYFILDSTYMNAELDNDNVYMGVIPSDGITHGDYTHGAANRNNLNWAWDTSTKSTYDWTKAVDTNNYSKQTFFNVISAIPRTTKQYVINDTGVSALSSELWNCLTSLEQSPTDIENLDNLALDTFLVNNPINAIISLKKFPLSSVPKGNTSEQIYLGKYQCSTIGYPLAAPVVEYQFTPIDIVPKFGDCFLDYAPYTTMQLFIPFCGTVDLNPADFMGRKLTVKLEIDFITGNVTAFILADYLVIQSATGTIAVDLPVTGTEQYTVDSQIINGILNEQAAREKVHTRKTSGEFTTQKKITEKVRNLFGNYGNERALSSADYSLTHTEIPLRQIGSATPLCGWKLEFTARLIIYYPESDIIKFNPNNTPYLDADKLTEFGHLKGFATVESGQLSNYPGFTVCNDVNLDGISATDTEKDMIMQALQSGVYI